MNENINFHQAEDVPVTSGPSEVKTTSPAPAVSRQKENLRGKNIFQLRKIARRRARLFIVSGRRVESAIRRGLSEDTVNFLKAVAENSAIGYLQVCREVAERRSRGYALRQQAAKKEGEAREPQLDHRHD